MTREPSTGVVRGFPGSDEPSYSSATERNLDGARMNITRGGVGVLSETAFQAA